MAPKVDELPSQAHCSLYWFLALRAFENELSQHTVAVI